MVTTAAGGRVAVPLGDVDVLEVEGTIIVENNVGGAVGIDIGGTIAAGIPSIPCAREKTARHPGGRLAMSAESGRPDQRQLTRDRSGK